MRRNSNDEVAEAARRRLELLSRELAQVGLRPDELRPPEPEPEPDVVEPPAVVKAPGRHTRRRAAPAAERASGWLQDRLPPTLQGRVGLSPRHLPLLIGLAVVALLVAGYVAIRAQGGATPVPRAGSSDAPGLVAASPVPTNPASPNSPTMPGAPARSAKAGAALVVDIAGKVRRPGVATLPSGSRVVDAIKKAGGPKPGVSLTSLNLARPLVDGEQILVGVAPAPGVAASAAAAPGAPASGGQLVSLNTATESQLDTLPGVGPVTAKKILAWRTSHGSFSSVDELLEVDGIGEKTLAELAPFVTL